MTVFAEITRFSTEHDSHGVVSVDATDPTSTSYTVTAVCPCGERLERVVGLAEATRETSSRGDVPAFVELEN
jgi:hypothetical protein